MNTTFRRATEGALALAFAMLAVVIFISPTSAEAAVDGTYWYEATTTAWDGTEWGFQYSGSAVLGDKLWAVLGDSSVWFTEDGVAWEMATGSFDGRAERWDFGMLAFNNELWVLGGQDNGDLNDVWHSADGVTWTLATSTAEWNARGDFAAAVFDDKMWVLGGDGDGYLDDLWYSEDGVTWTMATDTAPWGEVNGGELIEFNGQLWLLGGNGNETGVWSSPDGLDWELVDDEAWTPGRSYFGATVFNGRLYVLGGYTDDVWSTADGSNWTLMTDEAPWGDAGGAKAHVFDDKLWFLGGDTYQNSVWYSVDTVTVTFDGQGGSAVSDISGASYSTTTLPAAPTRSGYTFQNWNTAAGGSGTPYAAGAEYTFTVSDITLYAIWQADNDGDGNTSGSSSVSGGRTAASRALAALAPATPAANITAAVAQLHSLIAELQARGVQLPAAVQNFLTLYPNGGADGGVRDLELGMEGGDVRSLQTLLIGQGHAIPAGATGWFGEQTRAALAAYQQANGIVPAAGYFGPVTRAFMKAAGLSGLWWYFRIESESSER